MLDALQSGLLIPMRTTTEKLASRKVSTNGPWLANNVVFGTCHKIKSATMKKYNKMGHTLKNFGLEKLGDKESSVRTTYGPALEY